jgi:Family of unknown function (DUF5761)
MAGTNNGRVALLPGENGMPFHLFSDAGTSMKHTMATDSLKDMELNETAVLFMSSFNLDAIQQGLRYQVYVKSEGQHTIGRQSDTELIAIMRSVYLQYGRNTTLSDGSADLNEIRRLNGIVIDFCVKKILSEIDMYLRYRSDITALPTLMDRGEFVSSKGSRMLFQNEF